MFQEDKIIKQLFNLNYEKQKQIDTLNKKVSTIKYQSKYLRVDVKILNSNLNIKNRKIKKLQNLINELKTYIDEDIYNSVCEGNDLLFDDVNDNVECGFM
jgi:peptidoglycan hydrolase CwlO-like protein